MIVFAVNGLWHGADLRYLEWGIACGVISVIAQLSKLHAKCCGAITRCTASLPCRHSSSAASPTCCSVLQWCFFASAIYNAAPGEVFAGILQGWQGGFAAEWESVTNLVTSSGIDGRLPVVLTCGTAIVLAIEQRHQCCPLDPQAVLCAALDGLLCRCGIHLVLCRVRAVGVHLPAILTGEGDQLCQHRPLLLPRAAPKKVSRSAVAAPARKPTTKQKKSGFLTAQTPQKAKYLRSLFAWFGPPAILWQQNVVQVCPVHSHSGFHGLVQLYGRPQRPVPG